MGYVRYATFDPEAFAAGTGLLDDADVIVKEAGFRVYDYNGKADPSTTLRVLFEDAEGKAHEQYYGVGKPDKFTPSDDGKKILLTGTATAINVRSNFAQFAKSLVDAGVPRTLLQTDDIGVIAGMRLHVNAVVQKDKDGKETKNDKGYARTVLLATKLIALPGEKPTTTAASKATSAKATGKPATTTPASEAPSEVIADKTVRYLTEVAKASGGSVPRAKVSALVFQAAMKAKDADKAQLPKLAFDPEFLTAHSGRGVQVGDEFFAYEYDATSQTISAAA